MGLSPSEHVEIDGRWFAAPGRVAGPDTTVGQYHETPELVWAEYAGGDVIAGRIVGRRLDDGTLDLAYGHAQRDGTVVSGRVHSIPTSLPDGRTRIEEHWRRLDGSSGVSVIEELAKQPAPAPGETPPRGERL
jgi:hypothetical protein